MKPHPLSLIALALWFSTCALILLEPIKLTLLLGLCLLSVVCINGLKLACRLSLLLRLLPLLAMLLLIQLMFVKGGRIWLDLGWLRLGETALWRGTALILRLLVIVHSAQILLKLSYPEFEATFATVRLPEELAFMVFYSVQIIPRVGRDLAHYRQLLLIRGIEPSRLALRTRLRVYSLISLTVVANLLSRSGIQATALELRGFRSKGKRSRLERHRFGVADLGLLLGMVVVSYLLIR